MTFCHVAVSHVHVESGVIDVREILRSISHDTRAISFELPNILLRILPDPRVNGPLHAGPGYGTVSDGHCGSSI